MKTQRTSPVARAATVAGLVSGAVGIGILWRSGVEFPFTAVFPPGVWILLTMAAVVAFGPSRWAPGVGAFGGLFVTFGFVISGSVPNLFGADGTNVLIGSWVQSLGVLTAFVAGTVATRANYGRHSVDTEKARDDVTKDRSFTTNHPGFVTAERVGCPPRQAGPVG